ncbi:MAG: GNAT family N-acetyltransferase [Pseudomonadota bacterium]
MLPDLKTNRLRLRNFTLADAPRVCRLAGTEKVSRYTLNIPHPYEEKMAYEWIDSQQMRWEKRTEFVYAIILQSESDLIGAIGLHEMDNAAGELGYWIGESYWGNGYCAEAAEAIIQFSFSKLGLQRIQAQHIAENAASGEVLKKINMHYLGNNIQKDRYGEDAKMELYEIQNHK